MRILIIGGSGTLGGALAEMLSERAEVLRASRSSADLPIDISDPASIRSLFARLEPVDGLVVAAGAARFAPLLEATDDDWAFSLANKLMGQVNVVRFGAAKVKPGGAIVLTTGFLAHYPIPGSSIGSTVNAALEGFMRSAASELAPIRVNAVSPGFVAETLAKKGQDPSGGIPAAEVAAKYVAALESRTTAQVFGAQAG